MFSPLNLIDIAMQDPTFMLSLLCNTIALAGLCYLFIQWHRNKYQTAPMEYPPTPESERPIHTIEPAVFVLSTRDGIDTPEPKDGPDTRRESTTAMPAPPKMQDDSELKDRFVKETKIVIRKPER